MQSGAAQKVQCIMQCFSRYVDDVMQKMLFFIEELMTSQARSHLHIIQTKLLVMLTLHALPLASLSFSIALCVCK